MTRSKPITSRLQNAAAISHLLKQKFPHLQPCIRELAEDRDGLYLMKACRHDYKYATASLLAKTLSTLISFSIPRTLATVLARSESKVSECYNIDTQCMTDLMSEALIAFKERHPQLFKQEGVQAPSKPTAYADRMAEARKI